MEGGAHLSLFAALSFPDLQKVPIYCMSHNYVITDLNFIKLEL